MVEFDSCTIHCCVVDGVFFSILSSYAWRYLSSLYFVLIANYWLDFDRRPNELLGILPQFPISLGRKIALIDVCSFQVTIPRENPQVLPLILRMVPRVNRRFFVG
jgi:hypothetical protein